MIQQYKNYNIDLMLGFRKTVKRFNAGLFSGKGINMRNEGKIDLAPNIPKENKYFLVGLPINARFNYLTGRKFAAGIAGYANINSSIDRLKFYVKYWIQNLRIKYF